MGFRTWRLEDMPLALALWTDPSVGRWLKGPLSAAAVQSRLEEEIRRQEEHRVQYWPVFLLTDGAHAGCAGLRPKAGNTLELGYYLKPVFWGVGFATEAAARVVEYAFTTVGVESLFAGHHPENRASQRVLEKLGFERSGEEFYEPSGVVEPTYQLCRAGWYASQDLHQSANSPVR